MKLFKTAQLEDVLPEVLITSTDLAYMHMVEHRLPWSVLRTFRQKAIREMIEEQNKQKLKDTQQEGSGSWWG
ncbi:hypothetical protein EON65_50745, partial [archaeon]